MRTLVIDSATQACSVALFDGGKLLAHDHRILGRGHAEQLVPMIARLPGKGRAARIIVARGPGSFTGVRVGIAAARALALAWQAGLTGYATHALLAAIARKEHGAGEWAVCTRAGHGEWFCGAYDANGKEIMAPVSLPPEQAAQALSQPQVAGDEAGALVDLRGHGEAISVIADARGFPYLPDAALGDDIAPIYGRGPDAKPSVAMDQE